MTDDMFGTDTSRPVRVLAIPGSLRGGSYNRALLQAAATLAPMNTVVDLYEGLESVPLFNEDLESEGDDPPGVVELRRAVAAADGLLIATPEYNQSVPGVVKNMVDWLSRSRTGDGLAGKPVAVVGASTGPWGTRISQTILRQMLLSTQALVMPRPTLFVRHADTVFDLSGALVHDPTRDGLREVLTSLRDWIQLVSPGS